MLKVVLTTDTGHLSKYTDISGSERTVKHSIVLQDATKEEIENEIIEELNRIFAHKAKE